MEVSCAPAHRLCPSGVVVRLVSLDSAVHIGRSHVGRC
jgi:hypothetical protein